MMGYFSSKVDSIATGSINLRMDITNYFKLVVDITLLTSLVISTDYIPILTEENFGSFRKPKYYFIFSLLILLDLHLIINLNFVN